MRIVTITLLSLLISLFNCDAQEQELNKRIISSPGQQPTKELLNRIAIFYTICRLNYESKYDSILTISRSIPFRDSFCLYDVSGFISDAYFQHGDTVNGLLYVVRSIENQGYSDLDNLHYALNKYKLDSNKAYGDIERNFDKLHERYSAGYNMRVLNECHEIFYTDIRIRNLEYTTTNTAAIKYMDGFMYTNDSINAANFQRLMQSIGRFPGINDVGWSFLNSFNYSVKHFAHFINSDTLYKYLMVSTLNGQIPNWYGPSIIDRRESYQRKPLIYGEFGMADDFSDDGTYHYEEIKDIDHVDKRRAKFLLPPLYREVLRQKCKLPQGYDRAGQK